MRKILLSAFRGEPRKRMRIVTIHRTIIFVLLNIIIHHIHRVKFLRAKGLILLNINIQMWFIFFYDIP